jgi:hypothetical protein
MAIHLGAYCMDVGPMPNLKHDAADHSLARVDQILLGMRLAACRWHRAVDTGGLAPTLKLTAHRATDAGSTHAIGWLHLR